MSYYSFYIIERRLFFKIFCKLQNQKIFQIIVTISSTGSS
jgi:hypothetical protein